LANQDIPRLTVYIVLVITIIATFFLTISILKSPKFVQEQPDTLFIEFGPQATQASVSIIQQPPAPEQEVASDV
jgi:hypothetical protein